VCWTHLTLYSDTMRVSNVTLYVTVQYSNCGRGSQTSALARLQTSTTASVKAKFCVSCNPGLHAACTPWTVKGSLPGHEGIMLIKNISRRYLSPKYANINQYYIVSWTLVRHLAAKVLLADTCSIRVQQPSWCVSEREGMWLHKGVLASTHPPSQGGQSQ
jgi:hypothetical protein